METLQRTANRGSISTGYDIEYSNKFESDNGEGITRNYDASTGANCIANNSTTNAKKFTVSYWVKKTELLASGQNIPWIAIAGGYATVVKFQDEKFAAYDDNAGWSLATNAVFRDTSAWYHLVCAVDTTQSTAANRVNLYVNGVLQTSFSTENYGTQDADNQLWRTNTNHTIGNQAYFKGGYIAELHCIDGTQYAASDFGEYDDDSGIWIPKEADVTYGDQGYYLNWSDFGSANSNANNTGVGKDFSGNTNPFVNLDNWSSADIATDSPTNNFAIGNILTGTGGYFVITEGATKAVLSTAGPGNNIGGVSLVSTLAPSSGKWYFEAQNTNSGDVYLYLGVSDTGSIAYTDGKVFGGSGSNPSVGWRGGGAQDGKVYINNSATGTADTWETEVVGVALDLDNGKIYFHKSGTYINSGDPASGTDNGGQYDLPTAVDGQWYLGFSAYNLATWLINFGGYTTMSISSAASDANGYGTFEYAPPTGYYALCTKNLAEYG